MKKQIPTLYAAPPDEDNVNHALADWLEAVEQIQHGYQSLEKAINTYQTTSYSRYSLATTAIFYQNCTWSKADLITLRLTLCDKLVHLLVEFEDSSGDRDSLRLAQQFRHNAICLRESYQTIQVALGLASSANA